MKKKSGELESEYLLPKTPHGNQQQFSMLRARIASAFIPMLIIEYHYLPVQASEQLSYYTLAITIPAVFSCLLAGSYIDYIGRRPLLLIPVFTNLVKIAVHCCVIRPGIMMYFPVFSSSVLLFRSFYFNSAPTGRFRLDLRYIYISNVVDGMCGSWYFFLMAMYSITADITSSKKDRTFWMLLLVTSDAIMGSAVTISVGYLINIYGYFEATLFLCGLAFVAFIVPLLFLPETLQQRRSIRSVSPLTHLRKILGFYFLDGSVRRRTTYGICLLMFATGVANDLNVTSLDTLYQMHDPFCWNSVQIGDYRAIRSGGGHLCALILFKLVQTCVSIDYIGLFCNFFQAGAFVFEALVTTSWQLYLVPVMLMPSMIFVSVTRTIFSILAGPAHQGAVFSSIAVAEALCSLVTSQVYNRIYSATVSSMPGAVYLFMASVSCVTIVLFGIYLFVREKPQHSDITVEERQPETETRQLETEAH